MKIDVLDHGFVRLDAAEATDLSVVNAARVSFGKRKEEMDEKDAGLIRFLMRNKHATPFEHSFFRWHIKAPIAVAREWFRHRWASYNEYSLRYSEALEDYYVPILDAVRSQVGKPGQYHFESLNPDAATEVQQLMEIAYSDARTCYLRLLAMGVAKELARYVLPVGLYTEWYWSCNARSLMNFLALRNDEAAMREIREYAQAVEQIFASLMPVTHAAFVELGRVAP